MKLVIHPPVDPARLEKIRSASGRMTVVNAADEAEAKVISRKLPMRMRSWAR